MNKEYKKVIEKMNAVVNDYHKENIDDGVSILEHLKNLSTSMYYINTVRVIVHNEWQSKVKKLVDEGLSVSRAENIAHVEHPEMYELRRVMDSGNKVLDALRSNLSFLKQEMNQSNN